MSEVRAAESGQADPTLSLIADQPLWACPNEYYARFTAVEIISHALPTSGHYRDYHEFRMYEGPDLAHAAILWFDRDMNSLDPNQLRAISIIKDNKLLLPYYERLNGSVEKWKPPISPTLMKQYVAAFNDLFFFGSLSGLIRIEWTEFKLDDPGTGAEFYSTTSDDQEFRVPNVILRIYTFPDTDHELRMFNILWTLLHEMTNAYFSIYACRSEVCQDKQNKHDTVGLVGYGKSWVKLAMKMEKAFDKFGLSFGDVNWRFNEVWGMAIEKSVALELRMARKAGIKPTTKMPWLIEMLGDKA
ncbi:hypothetical protein MMC30_003107 [Trapelia coarctata]|nr:hypothetical protein [Trapelia coarctata]